MDEYIKREAAIDAVTAAYVRTAGYKTRERVLETREAIQKLPADDVAPVRHGDWEIVLGSNGNEYMVCTCCRVSQDITGVFTYCPNCGAKMDGGSYAEAD